ncbi:MAG: hypothetical protein K1X48_10345 [Burkholderiaceae bacterium]|nr:hypothetical protein [Burkholderiaceae bacterium]
MIFYPINETQLQIGEGGTHQSLQGVKLPSRLAGKPASVALGRDLSCEKHKDCSAYLLQQKEEFFTLACISADRQYFAEAWCRMMRASILAPKQLAESISFPTLAVIAKKE